MNKKGKRGYKMKGFCPFTVKSSSPMKQNDDDYLGDAAVARKKARKEAYKRRRAERQERFRQTQGYQNMQDRFASGEGSYKSEQYDSSVADYDNDGRVSNEEHARYMRSMRGTVNPGKRSMADRMSRGSYVDPNTIGHQHKYATGLDDLTARERRAIASGDNLTGTIPKFAMRGLSSSTHEGRMRVLKINAYKNFTEKLQGGNITTPEQYQREYERYQETLARMADPRSTSNFIGFDSYDKYGRSKVEKYDRYKRQRSRAIGIDKKTGRYILPGPNMSKEEAREARLKYQYPELYAKREADRKASKKKKKQGKGGMR